MFKDQELLLNSQWEKWKEGLAEHERDREEEIQRKEILKII